jgi:LPS sulfotransferase NodH
MESKILIFALARTGSTALFNLLNLHNEINLIYEPFNQDSTKKYLCNNLDDLKNYLNEIEKIYNGIKHVHHFTGWPFKDPTINKMLLTLGFKIIFLNRRDVFHRNISSQVSTQNRIWQISNDQDRNKIKHFPYKALDEDSLRWHLLNEKKLINEYKSIMTQNNITFFEVWYEDIFGLDVELDRTIGELFSFLKLKALDLRSNVAKAILNKDHKIISDSLLEKIPNYEYLKNKYCNASFQ